jgi:outer membrane biogenesis lipoprotein LolB
MIERLMTLVGPFALLLLTGCAAAEQSLTQYD